MTYIEWITNVERVCLLDYVRMPETVKMKFRANYAEYCELYQLVPCAGRI